VFTLEERPLVSDSSFLESGLPESCKLSEGTLLRNTEAASSNISKYIAFVAFSILEFFLNAKL